MTLCSQMAKVAMCTAIAGLGLTSITTAQSAQKGNSFENAPLTAVRYAEQQGFSGDLFGTEGPGGPNGPVVGTCECYWDNGAFDGRNGQASMHYAKLRDARAADDFYLPDGKFYRLDEVCGQLLTNSANPTAKLQIWSDCDGAPDELIFSVDPVAGVDTGQDWFNLNVYEFCFDASECWLRGGMKYWVSVIGIGDGSGLDVYYFGTADPDADGIVQCNQAYWLNNPSGLPDDQVNWLPIDLTNVKKSDLAFAVCVSACHILCDNGDADFAGVMPSAISLALPDRRAADNFSVRPCEDTIIDMVQGCVLTNCQCGEFSLEIYDTDEYMCPGNLVATYGDPKVVDLETTMMTDDGFTVEAKLLQFQNLNLTLTAGKTYWVALIPSGTLSATDRTFFCFGFDCRKECQIKGMEAKFRRDLTYAEQEYNESLDEDEQHLRIHEWNPISTVIGGTPRDLSFLVCGQARTLPEVPPVAGSDIDLEGSFTTNNVADLINGYHVRRAR